MPRRYYRKKRTYFGKGSRAFGKRPYSYKRRIRRKSRAPSKGTQYFTRSVYMPGIVFSGAGGTYPVHGSMYFALSGVTVAYDSNSPCIALAGTYTMPNVTDFTSLYDKYSIRKVVVSFIPRNVVTPAISSAYSNSIRAHIAKDYSDVGVAFTRDQLLQYSNVKSFMVTDKFDLCFTPASSEKFYSTALSSGYGQRFKAWIDTDYPNVPHNGIKFYMPNVDSAGQISFKYDVQVKYYIAVNQVK